MWTESRPSLNRELNKVQEKTNGVHGPSIFVGEKIANLVISTITEMNNINIKIAAYILGKCEHAAKLTLENNDFQIDLGNWRGDIQSQK